MDVANLISTSSANLIPSVQGTPGGWEKTEEEMHSLLLAMDLGNSTRAKQKKV